MAADKTDASGKAPVALEKRVEETDGRRFSPSAGRNRDAIFEVWLRHMPKAGTVLEIASGTGEHGAHIATALAGLSWWYSDIDEQSLTSQHAWVAHLGEESGLKGPVRLDVTEPGWTAPEPPDAVYCANMIHITPFAATRGLIGGAGRVMKPGSKLMLYGPFARDGDIAPSNARFDEDLKRRDPAWGVRDLDKEITPLANAAGFGLDQVIEMPANNLSVIFLKQ